MMISPLERNPKRNPNSLRVTRTWLLSACAAVLLSACGGGDSTSSPSGETQTAAPLATGVTTLTMNRPTLPADAAAQIAHPAFHLAPALLNAPDDTDAVDNMASAAMGPRVQAIRPELRNLRTRELTVQALQAAEATATANTSTTADSASGAVATYSPAQIRAAYNLPALPASGTTLTAAQAAQLGAGQTIYLIDAMSDPNIAAELAAFNQKFGLPTCTTQTIPTNTALPLAAASTSGCTFSVVTITPTGAISGSAAPYDSGWATEMALDVQWSHAMAPLARIILINTPDASTNSFVLGTTLANSMGAGSVSMSFGTEEGSWTTSADSVFTNANMTYVASAGDSGPSVQWPAVSPNVVAVGGTSLTYSGTGTRSEVVWSDTGGGISQFTATPSYQNSSVPGITTLAHRSVSDVSLNADPNTGQYVAVITPGSSSVNWASVGGTSVGSPEWAGIFAVVNAMRTAASKAALGDPHIALYGQVAAVSGTYASDFADITKGSDGSCATCTAKVGYDQVTGLGTPNVSSLLTTLTGTATTTTPTAPVVTSASISGKVGTALSFTVSVTDANPVTLSLSGAPTGMTISSAGAVNWAVPVAGNYSVTVTAKDSKTGLSGSGIYTITIAAPAAPVVASASVSGKVGTSLSYTGTVTDVDTLSYSLSGAPSGMVVSSTGIVSWPKPVAGAYKVTLTAKDSKTGLSGWGVLTVTITSASTTTSSGPTITATGLTGTAGTRLSGMITFSDPGVAEVSVSIMGAPMGVMFSPSATGVAVTWADPVAGTYSVSVTLKDSAGHNVQTSIPITIAAK